MDGKWSISNVNEFEQRITQLENEVRRLRSREDALATFNQYLYGIDTGFIPDILDAFLRMRS